MISLSAIEDGSLATGLHQPQVTEKKATQAQESTWSRLRTRISERRRQLAAVGILILMGTAWFTDSTDQATRSTVVEYSEVDQMLADFDSSTGSKRPLREPAEPIETNPWGDVAASTPTSAQPVVTPATDSKFFNASPLTTESSTSSQPTLQPSELSGGSSESATAAANERDHNHRQNVKFTGRIRPLSFGSN